MSTFMDSSSNGIEASGAALDQAIASSKVQMNMLTKEAIDDVLWHSSQSNAMAKLKAINALAKSANEMA